MVYSPFYVFTISQGAHASDAHGTHRSSGSSTEHARACRDPLERSFADTNRRKEESPGGGRTNFEAPVTERSSGKDD